MIESYDFLKLVIDSIDEHIAVLDRDGKILFVNRSWVVFGRENDCLIKNEWQGVSYLNICDDSAERGDRYGRIAAEGIRKVIEQRLESFYLEYPCHSPDEKRWFMMRVTPCQLKDISYYIILHQNITKRKLAEELVLNQSRIDGLTNIPNRRYFDEFINNEFRRCIRQNFPITLAILDLDHFKLLNDNYGHLSGDECLKKIGSVLKGAARRPGDFCARYGGEEFAIVLSNTTMKNSMNIFNELLRDIRNLKIPNSHSPTDPFITASIGVATMHPEKQSYVKDLIDAADKLLYSAKNKGRNRVIYHEYGRNNA